MASLFSGHGQAFQALSAQAEQFHQQFVQLLNATAGSYTAAEATNASLVQTVQQDLQAAINAPLQTLVGSTPIGGLTSLLPGNLTSLLPGNLTSLLPGNLTSLLPGNLTSLLPGNLTGLLPGNLTSLLPGNLTGLLPGNLTSLLPGNLTNVPYNLFANIVNIPYYESLALQEYAFALGPAGSVGGVPGWIPPGATVANGGVKIVNGQPYYALGGTGSWYMESIGNTWGWDDGNWPQFDAILHFVLPFSSTESLAEQLQTFAQAELIDGSRVDSEFQTAHPLAYLGGWLHGETPLADLLAGTTFPTTLTDTIGQNSSTGIVNVEPKGSVAIWSGEPAQLQPLAPLQAIGANLTGSPAQNPIMLPNPASLIENVIKLSNEINYLSFNPFVTGSFLYWGAPTAYSIPSAIGGTIQDFTGIPNQFPLANHGAEPITGYTAGLPDLIEGLPRGFNYLAKGLLGYVSPVPPVDLSGPLDALGNLGVWPADVLRATGVADLWTLLTTNLPGALADFDTQVGHELASVVSSLLPGAGADLPITLGPT